MSATVSQQASAATSRAAAASSSLATSSPTSTDPNLFGTRTASASASSSSGTGGGSGNPYIGTAFGGGNPPSIYLICFVVIICLLLGISLFVATRALLLRRRLHQAWAATGYSDTFFENNPTIAALHGVQGWGAGGWGATQVRKREKKLGRRPPMFEVELPAEDDKEQEGEKAALLVGSSAASPLGDWNSVKPISLRIIASPDAPEAAAPVAPPAPPPMPTPTFLETLRGPPVRPLHQPVFFAPSAPAAPLGPEQTVAALERDRGTLELAVLVRLPVAPAELEEREQRRREREVARVAGEEQDDEGEDLPELWIATERVELL